VEALSMSKDEPAPEGEHTEAAPDAAASGGSGDVLDAAPITVLGEATPAEAGTAEQTPSPSPAGNRRRRTGIALITATGVVALAAAPFAMVAPHEHITSESASSPATAHRKPAPKNSATDQKKVVIPAPSWRSQGSSQQPPALPSQPEPAPPAADPPSQWGPPSESPTPDPASSGEPQADGPRRSPADSTRSLPSPAPEPKRNPRSRPTPAGHQPTPSATAAEHHLAPKAKRTRPAPQRIVKHATPHWRSQVIQGTYVLQPGEDVHTNRMRLSLQTDGDLVLRDEHDKVVWSTGTHAEGTHVVFQGDGNFVLYSSTNETLWSSRTDGHDGAVLVLRANGDLAITQGDTVLWHTGTAK
jgi:hypothetical protein